MERRKFLATSLATSGLALASLERRAEAQSSCFGGFVDLCAFGASGDGRTDDTAAFNAAVAATPPGGTLFVPYGRYRLNSPVTINKGITILGVGWHGPNGGPYFGRSLWNSLVGSVLFSTVTSGTAILWVADNSPGSSNLRDIAILGPGAGTSLGLQFSTPTPSMNAQTWKNVLIANFYDNLWMPSVEEGLFEGLAIWGAKHIGIQIGNVATGDYFTTTLQFKALNIQACGNEASPTDTSYGIYARAAGIEIDGVLWQGNLNTSCFLSNTIFFTIHNIWSESATATGYDIDMFGCGYTHIRDSVDFKSPRGIRVRGADTGNVSFENLTPNPIPLTIDSDVATSVKIYNCPNFIIADHSGLADLGSGPLLTNSNDANYTVPVGGPLVTVFHTATLTAGRVVTPASSPNKGDREKHVRTGGDAGGPWNLSIAGVKNLSQNTWVEIVYNGTAWVTSQSGSL